MVSRISVPPSGAISASAVPLWPRAISRATASPSPEPGTAGRQRPVEPGDGARLDTASRAGAEGWFGARPPE
jgi:hypothetical protein